MQTSLAKKNNLNKQHFFGWIFLILTLKNSTRRKRKNPPCGVVCEKQEDDSTGSRLRAKPTKRHVHVVDSQGRCTWRCVSWNPSKPSLFFFSPPRSVSQNFSFVLLCFVFESSTWCFLFSCKPALLPLGPPVLAAAPGFDLHPCMQMSGLLGGADGIIHGHLRPGDQHLPPPALVDCLPAPPTCLIWGAAAAIKSGDLYSACKRGGSTPDERPQLPKQRRLHHRLHVTDGWRRWQTGGINWQGLPRTDGLKFLGFSFLFVMPSAFFVFIIFLT